MFGVDVLHLYVFFFFFSNRKQQKLLRTRFPPLSRELHEENPNGLPRIAAPTRPDFQKTGRLDSRGRNSVRTEHTPWVKRKKKKSLSRAWGFKQLCLTANIQFRKTSTRPTHYGIGRTDDVTYSFWFSCFFVQTARVRRRENRWNALDWQT